jgi:hypothetical protein
LSKVGERDHRTTTTEKEREEREERERASELFCRLMAQFVHVHLAWAVPAGPLWAAQRGAGWQGGIGQLSFLFAVLLPFFAAPFLSFFFFYASLPLVTGTMTTR